jgi:hypothetical protein
MARIRLATFNLENLDDIPGKKPTLAERIRVMRPQLMRVNADILCLQEVNGQEQTGQPRKLLALDQLLTGTPLASFNRFHTKTTAGEPFDERNLVILSRFSFLGTPEQILHTHTPKPKYQRVTAKPADTAANDITWERPILKVQIDLGAGRVLHLLCVHMKSKIPTPIPGQTFPRGQVKVFNTASAWAEGLFISALKRVGQAMEARIVIDEIFDNAPSGTEPLIAMCGDFNDDNNETAVKAICAPIEEIGNEALLNRIMIPCEKNVPEPSRYSLLHLGEGTMIDHVLVSRGLLPFFRGTEIHNETLPDESGAFRTDVQFPESDHAPVVANFDLP